MVLLQVIEHRHGTTLPGDDREIGAANNAYIPAPAQVETIKPTPEFAVGKSCYLYEQIYPTTQPAKACPT
nr:hypothetical protein [uncultured Rhodopila sp.]